MEATLARVISLLWTDPRLTEKVRSAHKGWRSEIAAVIGVSEHQFAGVMRSVGRKKLLALVEEHPAGQIPSARFHASSEHEMSTTICTSTACQTSTPCGTSTCGSCYCQSGQCWVPDDPA
jgi:hypothetical protein